MFNKREKLRQRLLYSRLAPGIMDGIEAHAMRLQFIKEELRTQGN
jgi:hypothetical protein